MTRNPLRELQQLGQSIWLDFIERSILDNGTLARLIDEDGMAGLTSNPAIFEKAISHDESYHHDIARLTRAGADREALYSALVLEDIGRAADLFRPVYENSGGRDGFVSIEVSPLLARDTQASVREAEHLWRHLDRPNIMIKIPGTEEGLSAIHALLSEGINVNVTLLFSVPRYARVLETYLGALEERVAQGRPVDRIASVASFFLSRIDVKVDGLLDDIEGDEAREEEARNLRGTAAIASAALAYRHFRSVIAGERWQVLEEAGAQVQRLLWASTGTKDPNYSDIKYVEPLIAPHTVNTLPLDTLEAYRDHGRPDARIDRAMDDADEVLARLEGLGVSLPAVTRALEEEGIRKFVDPYEKLLATLARMRDAG